MDFVGKLNQKMKVKEKRDKKCLYVYILESMNLSAYKKNAFYVNYEVLCIQKLLNRIHKVRYKRDESSGFGFVLSIFNEGAQFILVRL